MNRSFRYYNSGEDYEIYINRRNIETVKDNGAGIVEIQFTSGIHRKIGPFTKDEIGEVIEYLTNFEDRFDPVNARMV